MIIQTAMNSLFWIAWILTAAFIETTKTTSTKTKIQACINGVLTLSCEAVKNTDTNYEVEWRIKFLGTDWMQFFSCRPTSDLPCCVLEPTLSKLGLKVLNNSDGNAILERTERNAALDRARILCEVHFLSDHSKKNHHLYEVNFTSPCVGVRIEQGRNLNLTKTLLMNKIQCAHVVDIEWCDGNGNEFAVCNSCQRCIKRKDTREPDFWNRVQIIRGSLMLTTIQESDSKSKIIIKIHSKPPLSVIETPSTYTIRIFVDTSRGFTATSTVTTASVVESTSRVMLQADLEATRSSLSSSRPSHSENLVVVPPTSVASLHSGSPTRRNGASATTGQLWTMAAIAATGFLCI